MLQRWVIGCAPAILGGLAPPDFLANVPLIGPRLTETLAGACRRREALRRGSAVAAHRPSAALGGGIAQLALSIFCSFFFYRDEAAVQRLTDVLGHVAGDRARHLLTVAYATLKGVVYGVIGAALAQASLAAFGYWLSGVPGRSFWDLRPASSASSPVGRR